MKCAIYLRKSREDREAEARGEGETLARHRSALLELAKNRKLDIGAIYEEIVSGETIAARPQMQQLLEEVEERRWEGVLVMEVERLARGNSIDQGIVSQAFSISGTKIITPYKTYDPSNEMDEEYFEFGLFMSRREYNTIKRRLIAGRIASVKEGKYMGKNDPFGYKRVKLQGEKGWTLEIVPEQAKIVQDIYRWYLEGSILKAQKNAVAAGYSTSTGLAWEQANTMALLRNPLYCGYVTWGRKKSEKTVKNGQIIKKRRVVKDYLKAKGRHEPIIDEEIWNAVQKKLDETPGVPISREKSMKNPYQGILYCACGHKMQLDKTMKYRKGRDPEPYYGLHCPSIGCTVVSSRLAAVDKTVLNALKAYLVKYKAEMPDNNTENDNEINRLKYDIEGVNKEIKKIEAQAKRAFELVEQGVYTTEQFIERRSELSARKEKQEQRIETLKKREKSLQSAFQARKYIIPQMQRVIDAFPVASVEEQHQLLLSVLDRIDYSKIPKPGQQKKDADIVLTLSVKIFDAENGI